MSGTESSSSKQSEDADLKQFDELFAELAAESTASSDPKLVDAMNWFKRASRCAVKLQTKLVACQLFLTYLVVHGYLALTNNSANVCCLYAKFLLSRFRYCCTNSSKLGYNLYLAMMVWMWHNCLLWFLCYHISFRWQRKIFWWMRPQPSFCPSNNLDANLADYLVWLAICDKSVHQKAFR